MSALDRNSTVATSASLWTWNINMRIARLEEQIAHVLSGRIRFEVAGIYREVCAGEALYLASNVPHRAETIETAVVIDTFSPPREDYLSLDEAAGRAQ